MRAPREERGGEARPGWACAPVTACGHGPQLCLPGPPWASGFFLMEWELHTPAPPRGDTGPMANTLEISLQEFIFPAAFTNPQGFQKTRLEATLWMRLGTAGLVGGSSGRGTAGPGCCGAGLQASGLTPWSRPGQRCCGFHQDWVAGPSLLPACPVPCSPPAGPVDPLLLVNHPWGALKNAGRAGSWCPLPLAVPRAAGRTARASPAPGPRPQGPQRPVRRLPPGLEAGTSGCVPRRASSRPHPASTCPGPRGTRR